MDFRYGTFRLVYGTLLIAQIALGASMPFATQYKKTFATWICLMLFTEGAHFVIIPTILRQIYGASASSIYGVIFTFTGLSNLAMIFIVGSKFGENYDRVF